MEAFHAVRFVQLVCCSARIGHYLEANADGKQVRMAGGEDARKIWKVRFVADVDGEPSFLLRSCFDRFLMATNIEVGPIGRRGAFLVEQGVLEPQPAPRVADSQPAPAEHGAIERQPPQRPMVCKPLKNEEGYLVIKNGSGGFLRSSRWPTAVTVAGDKAIGKKSMAWAVVPFQAEFETRPISTSQEWLDVLTMQMVEEKRNLTSIVAMLDTKKTDVLILKKRKHSAKGTADKFGGARKYFERKNRLPFHIAPWHLSFRENLASEAGHQCDMSLKKWQRELFDLRQQKQVSKVRIFKINKLRGQVKKLLKGGD